MNRIDLIVKASHFLTMEGEGTGYRSDTAMAVDKGKIIAIGPVMDIERSYNGRRSIDAGTNLVMPGFVDAHTHLRLVLLRGLAQDVKNWMMDGLSPFSGSQPPDRKSLSVRLGLLEAIRSGITTYAEYDGDLDLTAAVFKAVGVRGVLSDFIREARFRRYLQGEIYEFVPEIGEKSLRLCIENFDKWNDEADGRITVQFGPQGADFLSYDLLMKVRDEAAKRNTKIHMHVQQGDRETYQIVARYGKRPVEWLREIGYLDEMLIAVHLTDCTEEEAAMVASHGASMVLCSSSIGIIDGIVPPAYSFMKAGGVVGLGSDQAPGNNCHNMFNEMKLTALFNKIRYADPEIMPAWKVLRMATVEGARAIGAGDVTGSLEVGKHADFIVIDLNASTMQPVLLSPLRNIVPNLVYSARGSEVILAAVDGKVVMENGVVPAIDTEQLLAGIREWADQLSVKSAPVFHALNGPNQEFMRTGKY